MSDPAPTTTASPPNLAGSSPKSPPNMSGSSPKSPTTGQSPQAQPVDTASPDRQASPSQHGSPGHQQEDDIDEGIGDDQSYTSASASLTSSILDYRKLHGRTYQSSKSTEYWGPNDERQNDGLDMSHHFLTMLIGDQLFEAPIHNPKNILDVGTGTGIWAIDMADEYPEAEVIGFDISPIQPAWVPPNCHFYIDDAQLEWTFGEAEFDFVHIRALYGSISDWTELYRQAFRALRPGGYLENLEFTILLRSDDPSIADDPEHIFVQWAEIFYQAADRLGKTLKIGLDGRMQRAMEEAGFTDVVVKEHKLPCGSWPKDRRLKEIGMFNLAFMEQSLEGFALFLLREIMGWELVEVHVFLARMRAAIRDPKLRPYYIIPNVYARKPLST